MKLVMNMVRNLTIRLADANKMNEGRWLLLNVYQSLAPDEIERPLHRAPLTSSAPDRGSRTILQNHLKLASLSFWNHQKGILLREQAYLLALAQIHFIYGCVQ